MKIISWNVNGIRAIEKKGDLEKLLETYNPDVLLIQEIKAKEDQLSAIMKKYDGYEQFYNSAEKPGYAGTAIWVKKEFTPGRLPGAIKFSSSMTDFSDTEGRIARVSFGEYEILGIYFPNGGKSPEAWDGKLVFYEKFLSFVNQLRASEKTVIWAGDVNCAHEEIDLARPKDNLTSIGFLPEERAWITKVIKNKWVDVFRKKNPDKTDVYSWWHVITRARARNVGWRIDYFFVDEKEFSNVKNIEYLNDQMGSDHCPVLLEI
jgi:exodeoxyribonuclease-3